MKKTLVYLLASLVVLMFTVPAYAQIEWSGNISAGVESLNYGTETDVQDELQFTAAQVNLDLSVEIADGVTGVVEFRNPQWTVLERSMRIELTNLFPNATLMVGRILFPMGREADTETEVGNMMNNAMIGNSALHDEEVTGTLVDYGIGLKTALGAVNCLWAITNGNDGASNDNNSDKCMMLRLDGDVEALPGLSFAASYLTNDAAGENETNEETKMVIDAGYAMEALKVSVAYGDAESEEKTGAMTKVKKTEKDCLAIEASYAISDVCSLAVRHSTVDVEVSENGTKKEEECYEVTKLQVGINYNLADNTLLKLEYVDNEKEDKPKAVGTKDDYDGIKAAIAVAF